jgi:hypothetical protein
MEQGDDDPDEPPPPDGARPIRRRGLLGSGWAAAHASEQRGGAKPAACAAVGCGARFALGDLRLSPGGRRPSYYHPTCVEKLPPAEQLRDTETLGANALAEAKRVFGTHLSAASCVPTSAPNAADSTTPPADGQPDQGNSLDNLDSSAWDALNADLLYDALSTYVPTAANVPERYQGAVTEARVAVLRRIAAASDETAASPPWVLLSLMDRMLFSTPAHQLTSEGRWSRPSLQACLPERLRRWWAGDWLALLGEAEAEAKASAAQATGRGDEKDSLERAAAQVDALVRDQALGKAARRVQAATPLATDASVPDKLAALLSPQPATTRARDFPRQPAGPADAAQEHLRAELLPKLQRAITHGARRSAPGPLGARWEHWATLTGDQVAVELAAGVLADLVLGKAPLHVLRAHRSARLLAKPKGQDGVRPLACGSLLRRLGLQALVRLKAKSLRDAAGPLQFGVAIEAGVEQLYRHVQLDAERFPGHCLVHLDIINAFATVSRDAVKSAFLSNLGELKGLVDTWVTEPADHYWYGADAKGHVITVTDGLDQGCSFSTAAFCAALRGALDRLQHLVHRWGGAVKAFLDDAFVRVPAERVEELFAELPAIFAEIGLKLNGQKTAIWPHSQEAANALPPSVRGAVCAAPVVLGALLEHAAGEADTADGTVPDPELPARARCYLDNLAAMLDAGLSAQSALSLLRVWAAGALTHEMRLKAARPEDWPQLENGLRTLLGRVLNTELAESAWEQAQLPLKLGGLGLPRLSTLADAAYLGSLAQTLSRAAGAHGIATADRLQTAATALAESASAASQRLHARGVQKAPGLQELLDASRKGTQKTLTDEAAHAAHNGLLDKLPADQQAWLRSCGGPGAGAYLLPPRTSQDRFDNTCFRVATQLRLRALDLPAPYATVLGETKGGGAGKRHDGVRDDLAAWLRVHTPAAVRTEQVIPELADTGPNGAPREARLDVIAYDNAGTRILVDVAVTHPVSVDAARLARAALTNGAAARIREGTKRERYRTAQNLVPFVIETGGRVGEAARALACRLAPTAPTERSAAIADLWQTVSVTVQKHNAIMLLARAGN